MIPRFRAALAFAYRSQLDLRLSHEPRNALALVAKRYGVRPLEIVEFAPLLFHLVAAETLVERTARLIRLRAAREQVERLPGGSAASAGSRRSAMRGI